MSTPINNSDQLFELYSQYKSQIDSGEAEILIDQKTHNAEVIEKKTDEKSLDIFQKIEIWFRTTLRLDRKIEKELVKMMDKEFKAMEKETEELSKRVTKGVEDEGLSAEIDAKVTATLEKLEEHKKKLPSLKEKYAKPWEDITKKSSSLVAYGNLIAKRSLIKAAKTPQERITAINNFLLKEMLQNSPILPRDEALHKKLIEDNQALNLDELLSANEKDLHDNIESELNGLEKVFSELLEKPLSEVHNSLKGLKEKIAFLKSSDPLKAEYEAKMKEFEERFNSIDSMAILNAKKFVEGWDSEKKILEKDPVDIGMLGLFLFDANQVFASPLGATVQEKLGGELANTLQSVQDRLSQAKKSVTETMEKNNNTINTLEKATESMQKMVDLSKKSGQEQLQKLGYETPKSFQEIEKLLTEKENTVSDLKTKSDQLQKALQEIEQERENFEKLKQKTVEDYMKEDKTLQSLKQSERKDEALVTGRERSLIHSFNIKYKTYQQRISQIQQEIERHKINRDPETISFEELSTLYNVEEQILKKQTEEAKKETAQGGQKNFL